MELSLNSAPKVKALLMEGMRKAETCLLADEPDKYLQELFSRLLLLRNQIFHGSSTDRHSRNRDSLRSGTAILEELVPIMIVVMEAHGSDKSWPAIPFPRDGSPQNPDSI